MLYGWGGCDGGNGAKDTGGRGTMAGGGGNGMDVGKGGCGVFINHGATGVLGGSDGNGG